MPTRQPTLSDVAKHAGVSYATADRVVNRRGNVAAKSLTRVEAAVAALGYVRNVAAANLSQSRTYSFVLLLPDGPNAFFAKVRRLIQEMVPRLSLDRVELRVVDIPAFDEAALMAHLAELETDPPDGIALVAIDTPEVADAIERLRAAGAPVLTFVSDLPGAARDAYVGIDNLMAGRTAARLIRLAHIQRAGRVLPILGARSARDHAERLAGLIQGLAGTRMVVAPVIEGHDRAEQVETQLRDRMAQDAGITAIYSMGAGNAGLIRAIAERADRPMVVLHELVPHSHAALLDDLIDVVIDQRPEEEIRQVVACLRDLADRHPYVAEPAIVPTIYVKDNLPPVSAANEGAPT
ncbi:LacI family DNA-binding transcriptional regulator [Maritimibacter sp. DP1N21-5]|uniref:LacI family DNA-binding transcriptional regulator n=1 Tax=Maritimibacter sp. DP1N21-5 TaxID=2836867 RepID=UPI001C47E461|nr:LacI family DNA-binding transcriptional regulator [Maritimibacter sp. DP1N21-5]MBV7411107.1 LacI family DNA-binding transcriptional regulator [Maritimibacter sp. DP1N21-5]